MEEFEDMEELMWYDYNLAEPTFFNRAIKALQKICRGTIEYDVWQTRTKMDKTQCPVCDCNYDYINAETHHYPRTMFNVVADVVQKYIDENNIDTKEPLDIIQEVMHKHLANRIDNIVLCEPCHKKFHNNDPEVMDKVYTIWEEHLNDLKKESEAKKKLIDKSNLDFKDIE